jgi:hypothetical protein
MNIRILFSSPIAKQGEKGKGGRAKESGDWATKIFLNFDFRKESRCVVLKLGWLLCFLCLFLLFAFFKDFSFASLNSCCNHILVGACAWLSVAACLFVVLAWVLTFFYSFSSFCFFFFLLLFLFLREIYSFSSF